ncbi:MAG: hypothetical protein A2170_08015 [Deltaproteobacteria bacterium RBG_13_53_10]|nr:MAG: hypothetical protein A2170_08015 [Deltaproteobacteria bacterium RBG_13_53_10]
MLKLSRPRLAGLTAGLVLPFLAGTVTPAFARSISLKDAGIALWVFIIIGAIIVLLQLIPAVILFFSFIGTSSSLIFKKKKEEPVAGEEKVVLPGYEPVAAKK